MTVVVFALILLVPLLAVAALSVPLARWLGLPVSVLLAMQGLALGGTVSIVGYDSLDQALGGGMFQIAAGLVLDSHSMLYLFLPPLLFEMALAINVRRLLEDAWVVMTMAVLAVATVTVVVGSLVWIASPIALAACLLLGAAIATTDPGAVITTFREIGAPRRLTLILEGESLLNDAAAIAIFGLLLGVLRGSTEASAMAVAGDFARDFAVGAAVGLGFAIVAGWVYPVLARSTVAEVSVTVAIAYGSFIVTELVVGGSGVVAVVFAGLTTGTTGFLRMGPGNWTSVRTVWAQIGFWANALIMILAASLAPALIREFSWSLVPVVVLVYLGAMSARALILFGLLPLMARFRLSAPISRAQSILVLWGGVRGSVTLLLAISITEVRVLGDSARLLGAAAAAYTLATIFLNAATLAWLTRILGLNRLSPTDIALREKIVAGALERVQSVVSNLVRARDLEPEALAAAKALLGEQRDRAEAQAGSEHIPFGERLRVGLTIVAGQEARLIRRAFEEGAIGPRAVAALRLGAERIADAARGGGREAYEAAAGAALKPSPQYRIAVVLQRFFRFDRTLRSAIELHFTGLLESERIVRELRNFVRTTVSPMIGEDAAENLSALLLARHEAIEAEIEAVATQYPVYAADLEKTLVIRAAIRRERQQYQRLLNDGVIEQELHDHLIADLDRRERSVAVPPRLDLTLRPMALLDRVEMFSGLSAKQRRLLARSLRTRFTTPGEKILARGDRGVEMFFIASGAFELVANGKSQVLGGGDFFGEIALIQPFRRRTSDVISQGYCRILVLRRRDFQRIAKRDPSIVQLIRAAAEKQLSTSSVTIPAP